MTAEQYLDKHYQHGMHWKTVNRAKVARAMQDYARECLKSFRDQLAPDAYGVDNDSKVENSINNYSIEQFVK